MRSCVASSCQIIRATYFAICSGQEADPSFSSTPIAEFWLRKNPSGCVMFSFRPLDPYISNAQTSLAYAYFFLGKYEQGLKCDSGSGCNIIPTIWELCEQPWLAMHLAAT